MLQTLKQQKELVMENNRKRLYEGLYILSATLSEDARKNALAKITGALEKRGGEVHKLHDMGKKKLAYEIDGKKEGFYYLVYFSLGSMYISELWKEYGLNEDLLRFSTMKAKEVKDSLEFKTKLKER